MARARVRGFTLIELMVTVAILAIVVTLATGGYREYIRRASRVDATGALLRLAAAQEKFYAQNGRYAANGEMATPPPDGLGITGTERGFYDLEVTSNDLSRNYVAKATVAAGENQEDDTDCAEFTVNEQGLRAAKSSDGDTGTEVTARCWR